MRKSLKRAVPGERRTCRAFLWFPKTINYETRWMETAEWEEEWIPGRPTNAVLGEERVIKPGGWDPIRWKDQPDVPSRWATITERDRKFDQLCEKARQTIAEGERLDEQIRLAVIVQRAARLSSEGEPWYKSQQFGPTWPPWGGFEEEGRRRAKAAVREVCGFTQPIDAAARSAAEAWLLPPVDETPTDPGRG